MNSRIKGMFQRPVACQEIVIGKRLLSDDPKELSLLSEFSKIAVITDSNVSSLHGKKIRSVLEKLSVNFSEFSIEPGEKSKCQESVSDISGRMVSEGFDRNSAVLGFGGGVVGDIAGFIASSFKRGVPLVLVPTTLLAMVDSSIGGKNGINLCEGKNMLGSFHQPKKVLTDLSLLKTLPLQEVKNGLAEAIKTALALDAELFSFISENSKELLKCEPEKINTLVCRCAELKLKVAELDERDFKQRNSLNFGHTVGHAIEAATEFSVPHGLAIAAGMISEAEISQELELLPKNELEKIKQTIRMILPETGLPELESKNLLALMKTDKKNSQGLIRMALPERIGKIHSENNNFSVEVPEQVIEKVLGRRLN